MSDDLFPVSDLTPYIEAASTPLADAAMAFLRRSLSELDGMETVDDFVYLTGGDA